MSPKKVLTFGTFDSFHKGHEFYLKKAKEFGDELHVVVARDETVKDVKHHQTKESENARLKKVQSFPEVKQAYLGHKGDKYKIIEEIKPDIIVLGYDQTHFTEKLQEELLKRGLEKTSIIRLEESFYPEKYKSSLL
jgi:FAD synthetase